MFLDRMTRLSTQENKLTRVKLSARSIDVIARQFCREPRACFSQGKGERKDSYSSTTLSTNSPRFPLSRQNFLTILILCIYSEFSAHTAEVFK